MTFIQRFKGLFAKSDNRDLSITSAQDVKLMHLLSLENVTVTPKVAESLPVVYYCVDKISSIISSMPRGVYRRTAQGRESAPDHDQHFLISTRPNPYVSQTTFDKAAVNFLLLWGNFIARMHQDRGRTVAYEMWHPRDVHVEMTGGEMYYHNYLLDQTIHHSEIIHVPDGMRDPHTMMAKTRIQLAAEKIEEAKQYERFSNAFVKNGTHFGLAVTYAGNNDKAKNADIRAALESDAGASKAGRNIVAGGGIDVKNIGLPLKDSQFLETRQMHREEIALLFGFKPGQLGGKNGESFNSLEHYNIEFLQYPVLPIAKSIEQEYDAKIFRQSELGIYYNKFNFKGILRGSIRDRIELYKAMGPSLTANDLLRLEDMNTFEGGDVRLAQINMTTLENIVNNNPYDKNGSDATA